MRSYSRHWLFVTLIFAIVLAGCLTASTDLAHAKADKMKMPVKIVYPQNGEDGGYTMKFKYNSKGDVIQKSRDGFTEYKIKYTYKNDRKTRALVKSASGDCRLTFDNKGRIKDFVRLDNKASRMVFAYGKKGYTITDAEGDTVYKASYKGKTLVKTAASDGKTYFYQKNGLLRKVTAAGNPSYEKVRYKMSGKYVKKLTVTASDGSSYTFKYYYGKRKANASRYYKIINGDPRCIIGLLDDVLLEGDGPHSYADQ